MAIKANEYFIDRCVGGAKSEGQWREEFYQNGLNVEEPEIADVEVGIQRVYGLVAQGMVFGFSTLERFWREIMTYRYETDPDTGEVLAEAKIIDKNKFHAMDSLRYLCSIIRIEQIDRQLVRAGGERQIVEYYDQLNQKMQKAEVIPRGDDRVSRHRGRPVRSGRIQTKNTLAREAHLEQIMTQNIRRGPSGLF
jgi:hypothetical protein